MRDQALDSIVPEQESALSLCSLTKRVMIVSPLPERVNSLFVALSNACFDVFCLHGLDEPLLRSLNPELIIYDALPLPQVELELDPLERDEVLLRNVINIGIPLVLLVAEDTMNDREQQSLELKGSQQLVWPVEVSEVLTSIDELLKRQSSSANLQHILLFKDLKIDMKRMIVTRDGDRIELTKTEYDLLLHFLTSDGSVQSREKLLDVIWGLQFYGGSNVVDVHIKSLRKKLEDSAVDPKYIATVRGVGYRVAD